MLSSERISLVSKKKKKIILEKNALLLITNCISSEGLSGFAPQTRTLREE